MKNKIITLIEGIVDNSKSKYIDIIAYIIMSISLLLTMYLFIGTLDIIKTPILKVHSVFIYSVLVVLVGGLFYITMLGDKTSKPVNRPRIFLFTSVVLALLSYSFLAETFNYAFTLIVDKLLEVADVPTFLILTNVRIFTVFVPILIVILVFKVSLSTPFNKVYAKELLEYQIDLFTRNLYKIDDKHVYIRLCEDLKSGEPVLVPEEITYRHKLINGNTGSGKTSLNIRPDLSQLFYKKALFRENLKELTMLALEKGYCSLNVDIPNKHLNENFSMKYITINEDKKEDFLELFKDYIIGVRDSKRRLYDKEFSITDNKPLLIEVPINIHFDIKKIILNLKIFKNQLIYDEVPLEFKKEINTTIEKEKFNIGIIKKPYIKKVLNEDGEEEIVYISKEIGKGEDKKIFTEYLEVSIHPLEEDYLDYSFNLILDEEGEGKIIYRDLGVTVVAPDGGLSKETENIAKENGVKVFKLDPKQEEIDKGTVAKFNPLLVGSPEKAGDIISSILVAMEQNSGKDSNPYFTNASIRAVRNVIILLKVMYPIKNNGKAPILTDALDMLSNFNLVRPYVDDMKKDSYLRVRWKSVIDYFETCFYPPPYTPDEKPIRDTHIGKKTKKTEEAISGIINQLDNFLGREEIRYILCDRENSLNLSEVLENGQCLAISTRQSELGDVLGKAFALMIILSIQNAVLGRYTEDENPEIPYHLIIDEFPFYVNDQTKVFFTFARKYNCAMTIAVQNLSQLEEVSSVFRQTVFSNCTTKIVLPGASVEDREYFSKAFGIVEEFETMTSVTSNPVLSENAKYSEQMRGQLAEKNKVTEQELADLKFKRCYYTSVDKKGNTVTGKGYLDFVKLTEENTIKIKEYNFKPYINKNITSDNIKSKENVNIEKEKDIEELDLNDLNDLNDMNSEELEKVLQKGLDEKKHKEEKDTQNNMYSSEGELNDLPPFENIQKSSSVNTDKNTDKSKTTTEFNSNSAAEFDFDNLNDIFDEEIDADKINIVSLVEED